MVGRFDLSNTEIFMFFVSRTYLLDCNITVNLQCSSSTRTAYISKRNTVSMDINVAFQPEYIESLRYEFF